jgi:hypothetical protein
LPEAVSLDLALFPTRLEGIHEEFRPSHFRTERLIFSLEKQAARKSFHSSNRIAIGSSMLQFQVELSKTIPFASTAQALRSGR